MLLTPADLCAAVKRRFPSPASRPAMELESFDAPPDCSYCVGGALQAFWFWDSDPSTWPDASELSETLQEINPKLNNVDAHRWAESIIKANDSGLMPAAWRFLLEALKDGGLDRGGMEFLEVPDEVIRCPF